MTDRTGVPTADAPSRPVVVAGESATVLLTAQGRPTAGRGVRRSRASDRWRRACAVLLATVSVVAVGIAVRQTADAVQVTTHVDARPGDSLRLTLPDVPGAVMGRDHVTLPSEVLDGLAPGDERTFTIRVSNDAAVSVLVGSAFAWAPVPSDEAFVEEPQVRVDGLPPALEPGASAAATVTVSTPDSWDTANRGRTGRLVVRFVGTQA
ncbi:hypothetical protein [Cellulomonas gelida]|uniref:hypothetical protein n=1 Tax=Cellulomonas gelida TaxID=1712 RepID=UPI0011445CC2|nr:hypothetical protein [Cellulomonas gelida]